MLRYLENKVWYFCAWHVVARFKQVEKPACSSRQSESARVQIVRHACLPFHADEWWCWWSKEKIWNHKLTFKLVVLYRHSYHSSTFTLALKRWSDRYPSVIIFPIHAISHCCCAIIRYVSKNFKSKEWLSKWYHWKEHGK